MRARGTTRARLRLAGLAAAILLPLAGSPAAASAAQNFDQTRAADIGVSENGTTRATGWDMPGECVKSMQRWIQGAGGRAVGGGVYSSYVNSPADLVATGAAGVTAQAKKGDVIQYTYNPNREEWHYGVHTVMVVANNGNGTLKIVQSNVPAGSGRVTVVDGWRPSPPVNFTPYLWRFGQVPPTASRRPDFTGDGKADLLYMDPGSTVMRLLTSTGTGFVGASAWASGMGQPAWQVAGDFNGDGRSDLVYQDANSTNIRVLTSGGAQNSGNSVWAAGMGMSAWRVAGDFTGDGKADVLYMDPGQTVMRLLTSTGTGFVGASAWASGMGQPAWQLAGDFNGDGRSDLVYQDANSTNIRVLTSGGAQNSGNSVWAAGMGMSAWRVA